MTTGATAYMYNGQYQRYISATTGPRNFPMGTAAAKKDATIDFTAPPTIGTLTARWSATPPAAPTPALVEPGVGGPYTVDAVASQGSWFLDAIGVSGTYTGTFTAMGLQMFTITQKQY